jgi:hypothetical protein
VSLDILDYIGDTYSYSGKIGNISGLNGARIKEIPAKDGQG